MPQLIETDKKIHFPQLPLPLFLETRALDNMEVDLGAAQILEEVSEMMVVLVGDLVNMTILEALGLAMAWKRTSLALLGKIIPSMPSLLRPRSPATVRWTVVTTQTPRQSARLSTSAPAMEGLLV